MPARSKVALIARIVGDLGSNACIQGVKEATDGNLEVATLVGADWGREKAFTAVTVHREIVRRVGPFRFLDRRAMRREAARMLSHLSINVPSVDQRVRRLSGGQRQAISICRAVGAGAKLVVMDEPTAALGVQETGNVETLIRQLKAEHVSVVLVSHNFDQVRRLADQVWVMRAGRMAASVRAAEVSGNDLVALVTGTR